MFITESLDPRPLVAGSDLIVDADGQWPNFHDAEISDLHMWCGDVRPEDDIFIGPQITVTLTLCALQTPIVAVLRFDDCEAISLPVFGSQNPIMDLHFGREDRGFLRDGTPMTPYILVHFLPALGFELAFKCFQATILSADIVPA
jgi:hypothetical protein